MKEPIIALNHVSMIFNIASEQLNSLLSVSHSTEQVKRVCDKAIWIEKGHMRMIGDVKEVCSAYRQL